MARSGRSPSVVWGLSLQSNPDPELSGRYPADCLMAPFARLARNVLAPYRASFCLLCFGPRVMVGGSPSCQLTRLRLEIGADYQMRSPLPGDFSNHPFLPVIHLPGWNPDSADTQSEVPNDYHGNNIARDLWTKK